MIISGHSISQSIFTCILVIIQLSSHVFWYLTPSTYFSQFQLFKDFHIQHCHERAFIFQNLQECHLLLSFWNILFAFSFTSRAVRDHFNSKHFLQHVLQEMYSTFNSYQIFRLLVLFTIFYAHHLPTYLYAAKRTCLFSVYFFYVQ